MYELKDTSTALEVLGVDYFELERYARAPPKMGVAGDRVNNHGFVSSARHMTSQFDFFM